MSRIQSSLIKSSDWQGERKQLYDRVARIGTEVVTFK